MRVLLLTDTHGNTRKERRIQRILEETHIDIIAHAGDFSDFGHHYEGIFDLIRQHNLPFVFCSGNHESNTLCEHLAKTYHAYYIDYQVVVHHNTTFVGIAGYDIFSSTRNKTLLEFARSMDIEQHTYVVVLSHEPPFPFAYGGMNVGSPVINQILNASSCHVVICGHFHVTSPCYYRTPDGYTVIHPGESGVILNIDSKKMTSTIMCEMERTSALLPVTRASQSTSHRSFGIVGKELLYDES